MFGWLKRREEPVVQAPTTPPTRLYMINGEPHGPYNEPAYPTDPEAYGMKRKAGVTDQEYAEACKRMKVFIKRDDAIDFAYHCTWQASRARSLIASAIHGSSTRMRRRVWPTTSTNAAVRLRDNHALQRTGRAERSL